MTVPSPFQIGGAIGNNISGAFQQQRDVSAIDQILQQAAESEDETVMQDAMRKIISQVSPERQQAALGILQNKQQQIQANRQAQAKAQSSQPDLSGAINALGTLENLVSEEGIGFLARLNPSDKARYNRGIFQSSQAALLPLFKSMFPRGITQNEFKVIKDEWIPQPGDTEEKIRGKIEGLKGLINQQKGTMPQQGMTQSNQTVEMRDAQGNIYDIPSQHVEQARAQGYR